MRGVAEDNLQHRPRASFFRALPLAIDGRI
jgi:hypothetical protein